MPEDIVEQALTVARRALVSPNATACTRTSAVQAIDKAILEHKRTSDLHRLIAATIRQEIATEFDVRRQQALEAFQQAEHTLTLSGFAVPTQGN